MPEDWFRGARWTIRAINDGGAETRCASCDVSSRLHLWCSSCSLSYCRKCLAVNDSSLWDLGFMCAACSIESVCILGDFNPREDDLLELAADAIVTRSHAIKPNTWRSYRRCMLKLIDFMRNTKVVAFPVVDFGTAQGLVLFFHYLKKQGASWATMAQHRSMITNASRAGRYQNPWLLYPQLEELSAGLSRRLTTPVSRREGVTIGMLKRIVTHISTVREHHLANGNITRADVALRNLVALCFGFFGMRRGAELWLNKKRSMGLQRHHVHVVRHSHMTLFLPTQKNDTTGRGTEVVIAWVTSSGVRVGEFVEMLNTRLDQQGIPLDGPFLCPTGRGKHDSFYDPGPGKESRFNSVLQKYLAENWDDFSSPSLRARFSWHSLRRGGATWAFRNRVDMRLVMGHGAWRSEAGVAPYLAADLIGKLSVTLSM